MPNIQNRALRKAVAATAAVSVAAGVLLLSIHLLNAHLPVIDIAAIYPINGTVRAYSWQDNAMATMLVDADVPIPMSIYHYFGESFDSNTGKIRRITRAHTNLVSLEAAIAPDGKSITYVDQQGPGYRFARIAMNSSGKPTYSNKADGFRASNIFCLPDNKHWLCFTTDLSGERALRIVTGSSVDLAVLEGEHFGYPPGTVIRDGWGGRILGLISGGRLLIWPVQSASMIVHSGKFPLLVIPVKSPRAWSEYTVKMPEDSLAMDVALSGDGTRLAWISSEPQPVSAFEALLSRFIKTYRSHTRNVGLHVSRVDGSDQQLVGWLPQEALNSHGARDTLLRWLPDNKHISFMLQNKLWVTSASN